MFNHLKVAHRLALGFGALAVLLLAVCTVAYVNIARAQHLVRDDLALARQHLAQANAMVQMVLEQDLRVRQVGLLTDTEAMQRQAALARGIGKKFSETLDSLLKQPLAAEETALLEQARSLDEKGRVAAEKAIGLALAVQSEDAANVLTQKVDALSQQRREALDAFARRQQRSADALVESLQAEGRLAARVMMACGALGVVLALIAGGLVTRSVVQPLRQAVAAAERVAEGDLGVRLAHGRRDEIGALLDALDGMAGRLRGVISAMRSSSESVMMASTEIASGNHDLSARTEQQAGNLQATVSTISEMTDSVRSNAEAAQRASRLAAEASGVAGQGGERVGQVVTTMNEISASSRRIADIVGTIDGIAFQTNILALNAAVEAARAGEQGRGFAVVASEVRGLARRSAEAAREIKGLIATNVEKVASGSQLVADAGSTMADIVRSSERVAAIIQEISQATLSQASGLEQVSRSVQRIDESTQQNAALVEQSAAAAASLQEQTQALNRAVGVFRMAEVG